MGAAATVALNIIYRNPLALADEVANARVAGAAFTAFRRHKAPNTVRRHDAALDLFARYLIRLVRPGLWIYGTALGSELLTYPQARL